MSVQLEIANQVAESSREYLPQIQQALVESKPYTALTDTVTRLSDSGLERITGTAMEKIQALPQLTDSIGEVLFESTLAAAVLGIGISAVAGIGYGFHKLGEKLYEKYGPETYQKIIFGGFMTCVFLVFPTTALILEALHCPTYLALFTGFPLIPMMRGTKDAENAVRD